MKLALTEACSNSVRHAYGDDGGQVDITFELLDDRLIVEVADDGSGFVPLPADTNEDELTEGGLGIAIIRSIADEVEIGGGPDGRGARLRFVKRLDSEEGVRRNSGGAGGGAARPGGWSSGPR